MYTGKKFEEDFRKCAEANNLNIIRLQDGMGGYAGVNNICDFILYVKPHQLLLELKAHKGKSLPLNCITENQYKGLLEKSKFDGVIAGILINFYEYDKVYFVPIQQVATLKQSAYKSINIDYCDIVGIEIVANKKRTRYDYNVGTFICDLECSPYVK